MEIIVAEGSGGKTTELIQRSAVTGAVIVCTNVSVKEHILKMAFLMDLKIPDPVTYSRLIVSANKGEYKNGILIDDLDLMLDEIFGNNYVIAATFREEIRTPKSEVIFRRVK